MNTVDVAFLVIVLLSVLLGIVRGFVGEVLSLIALCINVWMANRFAADMAPWVAQRVALPGINYALAFLLIYGLMWLVTSTITYLCSSLIGALGLGWLDRAFGFVFGTLRGLLIILIIVLVVGLTPIPREPFWQEAMLTASAEHGIERLRPLLSDALNKRVDYKPAAWVERIKTKEKNPSQKKGEPEPGKKPSKPQPKPKQEPQTRPAKTDTPAKPEKTTKPAKPAEPVAAD